MRFAFEDQKLRARATKEIESWLGTPYRNNVVKKGFGADCSLFIAALLVDLGILTRYEKPDYVPKDWHLNGEKEIFLESFFSNVENLSNGYEIMEVIDPEDLMFGDWLIFSFRSKFCNHSALYIDDDKMVHALSNAGVRIDQYSRMKKHEVYRWRLCKNG